MCFVGCWVYALVVVYQHEVNAGQSIGQYSTWLQKKAGSIQNVDARMWKVISYGLFVHMRTPSHVEIDLIFFVATNMTIHHMATVKYVVLILGCLLCSAKEEKSVLLCYTFP